MKPAVCNAYGKPLDIEEVTLEPPRDNEVKVRVVATAICHSDIHSIKGEHAKGELSGLPGHEMAGYVEAIGKDVTYVQPGDPVVCCLVRSGCGHCHYCIIGLPHFCENWHFEFLCPGPYLNHQGRRMTLKSIIRIHWIFAILRIISKRWKQTVKYDRLRRTESFSRASA